MNIQICQTIKPKNISACLSLLGKPDLQVSLFHVCLDTIADLAFSDLPKIKNASKLPLIASCNSKEENGEWSKSESERLLLIEKAADSGFAYLEVGVETLKKHEINRPNSTKLIVSYYNLSETPKYWKFVPIINEMQKHDPDLLKISTLIQKEEDNQTLFRLLVDRPGNEQWIVQGLGKKARIIQMCSGLMGGFLTYVDTSNGVKNPPNALLNATELQQLYTQLS